MNSSKEEVKVPAAKNKQKVTRPQRLHYGLYNQGATCYLNSVLQVLFMTPEIHDRLDPKSELRNILDKMKERTCQTKNITKILDITNVYEQRDAAECLELILHKISTQASKVFKGELTYATKCSRGHSIIEETNPFRTLPLSLSLKDTQGTTYSVERGINRIFLPKSFSGNNMVYCNECNKKTQATSTCEMVKSPQILTLLLKRFDFDYNTMSHVKSDCCVDVPSELKIKKKMYKLYGMVNHMGGLEGGHYTATTLSNEDNTWYEFDDDLVNKVEEQPFTKTRIYNSSTAYLLLYRESLRDEEKDEPRGQKRKSKEMNIAKRENRQNQESHGQKREERTEEARSHQVRAERDAKREEKVSSLDRNTREEDALRHKENRSYSSKQQRDNRPKPEKMTKKRQGMVKSGTDEKHVIMTPDENSLQPKNCTDNKKKLLVIGLVFSAIVILIIVLVTTLTNP